MKATCKFECLLGVGELLGQFVGVHNQVFQKGLASVFRPIPFNDLHRELKDLLSQLYVMRDYYANLAPGPVPFHWQLVDPAFRWYCASLDVAYSSLADMCERLAEKARGEA